jgi:hypothetical protein
MEDAYRLRRFVDAQKLTGPYTTDVSGLAP